MLTKTYKWKKPQTNIDLRANILIKHFRFKMQQCKSNVFIIFSVCVVIKKLKYKLFFTNKIYSIKIINFN